ncbi:MAG: DNA polymerase IV [Peptococcaceae bacterium]|nr:DNA polymerase IV [Peptococcaceae bacterium]
MESEQRAIMHVDMDAFYAAIEQRDNPELKGKPVIVGGSIESRGVVSTASYEARKYGVHSAMPMTEAHRRCPHGVYLPVDMQKYRRVSRQIMEIFHRFTPEVEAISLDEAFLDVTGSRKLFGTAEEIGREIKRLIQQEVQLTASVGLSYNKFLAKLASDMDKPDGFYQIRPEELESKVWPLPIRRMMGVGSKTAQMLEKMGVTTIGQLAGMNTGLLEHLLGKQGIMMHEVANGIDNRPVEPVRESKSVGRETTFPQDISEQYLLETILFTLTDDVCHTLRSSNLKGKTVSIKIRYPDFHSITRAVTLEQYTSSFEPVFAAVQQLMQHNYKDGTAVRLIGVSVSNLKKDDQIVEQQDLFQDDTLQKKQNALNSVMDSINGKYGGDTVRRARKLTGWDKNGELS